MAYDYRRMDHGKKNECCCERGNCKNNGRKGCGCERNNGKRGSGDGFRRQVRRAAKEAKKAPARKTAARKAPAAKPVEVKSSVYVQFAGKEFSESSLTEAVKEAYTALGNRAEDIRTIDIYVKPEESVAYYTVNGQGSDEFKIEL